MENKNEVVTRTEPSAPPARARFVVDAKRSRFTVQAFATGLLSAMGHNPSIGIRTFRGEVEFDPEALQAAGLRITIQAASLEVLNDIADRDRREMEKIMKGDILDIASHPQITYESSEIAVTRIDVAMYSAIVSGNLALRGITRNQAVAVRITDMAETLRISGDFTLRQSDYQIKPISIAGGALKLKDELKFTFEMIARRQESGGVEQG